jgi:predicted RNA polymerase sigma factor
MAEMPLEAVAELYRSDWGRIVATLIRFVGDFDRQDCAQEAFSAAVERRTAVPEFPRPGLLTARNRPPIGYGAGQAEEKRDASRPRPDLRRAGA